MAPEAASVNTTLGAIASAVPALQRLAQAKLPVKAAYHLSKLCTLVDAELKHYHQQRNAFVTELGAERHPTDAEIAVRGPAPFVEVTPENMPAFIARMQELDQIEVTIPWGPIHLDALGTIDVTAADLMALDSLLQA